MDRYPKPLLAFGFAARARATLLLNVFGCWKLGKQPLLTQTQVGYSKNHLCAVVSSSNWPQSSGRLSCSIGGPAMFTGTSQSMEGQHRRVGGEGFKWGVTYISHD